LCTTRNHNAVRVQLNTYGPLEVHMHTKTIGWGTNCNYFNQYNQYNQYSSYAV